MGSRSREPTPPYLSDPRHTEVRGGAKGRPVRAGTTIIRPAPIAPPGESGMFCGIATTTAKAGSEEALVTAALDHAKALRAEPGCLATYVLRERGSRVQVSISVFENEAAFQHAVETTRPVIMAHHIERLWESPPGFRLFDVRT